MLKDGQLYSRSSLLSLRNAIERYLNNPQQGNHHQQKQRIQEFKPATPKLNKAEQAREQRKYTNLQFLVDTFWSFNRGTINAIEAFGWQILCFKQRDFFEKRLNRARQRSEFYLTEALWNYLWPEFGSAMLKDEKMQFISSGKWHLLKAIVMQRYFIVLTSNMALCRRDLLFKKIVRTKWNLISVITLFADAVKIYIW